MKKLPLFLLALVLSPLDGLADGNLEACLLKLKAINKTAKGATIKFHPTDNMPVVSWKGDKLGESDRERIYTALRFCATQGIRMHYVAKRQNLVAECYMSDETTGAEACQPTDQPKAKLVEVK